MPPGTWGILLTFKTVRLAVLGTASEDHSMPAHDCPQLTKTKGRHKMEELRVACGRLEEVCGDQGEPQELWSSSPN